MLPEDLADEWERAAKDLAESPPAPTALRCCAAQLREALRWRPVSEPPTEPGRYEVWTTGEPRYAPVAEGAYGGGGAGFGIDSARPSGAVACTGCLEFSVEFHSTCPTCAGASRGGW